MAIAYDTVVNASYSGSAGTSKTWSHTCTGSDRILFVNIGTGADNVTGVTYAGVAMTKITSYANDGALYTSVWALVAPATGANNIVVTCSSSTNIIPNSISYTGTKQTGQPDGFNTSSAGGTDITATITTVADNAWLMMFIRKNAGGAMAPGAGTTERVDDTTYGYHTFDSGGAKTPAGSHSLVGTHSSTKYAILVSIAPSVPNVTINPSAQALTFSLPAETVSGNARVSVNAQVANFSLPAETIKANWKVNVATQVATFTLPQYIVTAGGIILPATVQTLTFSLPAETVLGNAIVSPDAQTLTFSLPASTVSADWQVSVNPVVLTVTLPTLQFVGALWGRTPRTTTGADWTRSVKNNDA